MNGTLDNKILMGFQQGDENAFHLVFDHFYPALYHFTKKLTGSREDAEDIALHSFQKLFERCSMFGTGVNIKAFLYITARNNSLNYLYAQKRHNEKQKEFARKMQNDTLLQYQYEMKEELLDTISAAIENLPDQCRKIFKMLYYEDLKPTEIAEILNISESTVYNQKQRAIKALRLMLAGNSMAIAWIIYTLTHLQNDVLPKANVISC